MGKIVGNADAGLPQPGDPEFSQTHRPTASQLLEGAYVVLDNHSRAVLALVHDELLQ